jgi:hypothetical protein
VKGKKGKVEGRTCKCGHLAEEHEASLWGNSQRCLHGFTFYKGRDCKCDRLALRPFALKREGRGGV